MFRHGLVLDIDFTEGTKIIYSEDLTQERQYGSVRVVNPIPNTEMKQSFVLVLPILTGLSSVWASLGDSNDKIEDLYGDVVKRQLLDDGTVNVLYHKDHYLYLVIFERLRSVLETYSRIDRAELSPKEISRFLKANAGRATWVRRDTSKERRFERSDHKAEAIYLKIDGRPTLKVRPLSARQRSDGVVE